MVGLSVRSCGNSETNCAFENEEEIDVPVSHPQHGGVQAGQQPFQVSPPCHEVSPHLLAVQEHV